MRRTRLIAVDNGSRGAVYKGATLGVANGHNFLYATNFHTGKVETYDENFTRVNPNGFVDPNLPSGYGPFGIRNFNGEIFVTYAKQDATIGTMMLPVPAVGSSMCLIPAVTSFGG